MPNRRALTGLATISSLFFLTSCATTPVDASPAVQASTPACAKASQSWPQRVGSASPYPVTTPSDAVRAWGSDTGDAIIARCGVESPGPTSDSCIAVDDVDWVQTSIKGGYRFVTYGRTPALEVLIPRAASDTPGMLLPAFSAAAKAIPQGSHRCQ